MSDLYRRFCVGALALAGIVVTSYLTYARYADVTITCTTGGCETVQSSSYAVVLGVPVAVLGLAAYVVLLGTALSRSDTARLAGAVLACSAFVFSAYLLYVQLAIIGAVCDWCVVNDAVVTALTPFAVWRLRTAPAAQAPAY